MKIFKYGRVATSSTNAYGIVCGAKKLGIDVVTDDTKPFFPIPKSLSSKSSEVLFFTEEASLLNALANSIDGYFMPREVKPILIDDKWEFVEWLKTDRELTQGIDQWSIQEFEEIQFPYLLKAKHSWVDDSKMPRGWVCRTHSDLEKSLNDLKAIGLNLDHFFLQRWLGDGECRNISVCGFHDYKDSARNLYAIVERIASHTEGLSCSAALETISDDWLLTARSNVILNSLQFTGPFELEYLISGSNVYILELNPRFWMQHSIFLHRGNGVIKRYLAMDTECDRKQKTIEDVVWIDGMHLVLTVLSFRLEFLALVLKKVFAPEKSVLIWPRVSTALYVWSRVARTKFVSKFFS